MFLFAARVAINGEKKSVLTWTSITKCEKKRHKLFNTQVSAYSQNSMRIVAWENSRHSATPATVFPRNDVRGTSAEIPFYWHVTRFYFWLVEANFQPKITEERHLMAWWRLAVSSQNVAISVHPSWLQRQLVIADPSMICVDPNFKQLLDGVFVIPGIIRVDWLHLLKPLLFRIWQKTESNNCFIIHWKEPNWYCS